MSQTGIIGAALVIGFVVYVTAKGRLGQYLALCMGRGSGGCSAPATQTYLQPGQMTAPTNQQLLQSNSGIAASPIPVTPMVTAPQPTQQQLYQSMYGIGASPIPIPSQN